MPTRTCLGLSESASHLAGENHFFEWKCSAAPYTSIAMNLVINGQHRQFAPDALTAAELLTELDIKRERVAVVINENVVRRAELENTQLTEGDTIEIITMVGGG